MKIFEKKNVQAGEMVVYEILTKIAYKHNPTFSNLILPKALRIDRKGKTIKMPLYEGETFNHRWNESTGGSLLKLYLSAEVPRLIADLSKIDTSAIWKNPKLKRISKLRFNQTNYQKDFDSLLKLFVKFGHITPSQKQTARDLLKQKFTSPIIFNNGDFYPRNFIRTRSGKIVIIDWEIWNDNSRACVLDHTENVAAFCFVHMWGNLEWQKRYVRELKKHLPVTKADFQKALLIKSAEMANFWFKKNGKNALCANQLQMFKKALKPSYMNLLWR